MAVAEGELLCSRERKTSREGERGTPRCPWGMLRQRDVKGQRSTPSTWTPHAWSPCTSQFSQHQPGVLQPVGIQCHIPRLKGSILSCASDPRGSHTPRLGFQSLAPAARELREPLVRTGLFCHKDATYLDGKGC